MNKGQKYKQISAEESKPSTCSRPVFAYRELEPRIAFDGALLATALDGLTDGDLLTSDITSHHEVVDTSVLSEAVHSQQGDALSNATDAEHESTSALSDLSGFTGDAISDPQQAGSEIVFVDASVVDTDHLLATIDPSYELVFLDPTSDGIDQIADYLANRTGVGALHLISHGDEGTLTLGSSTLTLASMSGQYAEDLQAIGAALSDEADILIYGCNFGSGAVGSQAALQLSVLTGADVAASDDLTGHEDLGGDWDLEVATGDIESAVAISVLDQSNWTDVLVSPSDIVSVPGVAHQDIQSAYSFEVGSDLGQDDSGNAQDLTLYNGPTQTSSTDGSGALAFSSGDYAELPAYDSGGAMTVSAWVRFDSTASYQKVFDFGQAEGSGIGNIYVGRRENSTDLTFTMEVQGSYTNRATAIGVITDGQWLHFVATVDDDGAMTLYVNGAEAATFAGTALTQGTRDNYYIGKSHFAADGAFTGAIDDLVVINDAVTADQAAALYSQSSFAIAENSIDGAVVSTVFGTDADNGDNLTYSLVDDAGGRFAIDSSTGEITLADTALIDYETANSHAITVRATDSSAGTVDEVYTVSILDQSNEPMHTIPGAQAVDENGSLLFSSGMGNAITISDDSLADSVMSVTLDATNGEMTLAQLTGVTVVSGADSSDYMVLEGLESDLNAALDGLVFVPDENFNGAADISVTTSISSQLIGNYSFDAGTAANDSAYAGNDGTLVADATTTSDAEHGTVLTLDGAGDHVLVDGLFDQPDHVTLSAWVNLSAIDTGGAQVISLGDNVALSVDTLGFNYGVSGLIYNGSGWNILGSGTYIEASGWHHVAYSFDDTNDLHTLYLDGVAIASATTADSITYSLGADTVIGTHGNANTDYEFNGLIDDVRIYSRALSDSEIAAVASGKDTISDVISITVNAVNSAPSFGIGTGYNVVSLSDQNDGVVDIELLSDGSFIALSSVNTASSGQDLDFALTKYLADGSLDTSWGTNGTVITSINGFDETVSAIAQQADGKLLVLGSYNTGTSDHGVLIRYNVDGTLDATFGSGGILGVGGAIGDNDYGRDIIAQPDGKILATGDVYTGGASTIYVTRHNTDGSLDTSFGVNGLASLNIDAYDEYVTSILLQSDGKIILGVVNDTSMSLDFGLIRLNADGSYDTSFDGDGIWTNLDVSSDQINYSIALDTSGRILVAGTTNAAGNTDSFVMRVNSDGSLDATFGTSGSVTLTAGLPGETITQIAELPNGKILVAGSAENGTDTDLLVMRLNPDGSLDSSFGTSGYVIEDIAGADDQINGLAITATGDILVGGSSATDGFVAKLTSSGLYDLDFNITGLLDAAPSYVEAGSAVVLDPDVVIYDYELTTADNFDGASVQISRDGGGSSQDIFVESGTMSSLTEGADFSVDGVLIGTVTSNTAGVLVLTFNANATNALVNHALQQIAYSNSSSTPPANVTLNWVFYDGNSGAQGSGGNKTSVGSTVVSITTTNTAPVNNTPAPQSISVDQTLTFSSLGGNAISIADADAGGNPVEVFLTITNGTASLATVVGLSFSLGDGTDDSAMTFQGTIADINSALDGLVFTPTASFNGIASVAILTDDLGNSGAGGAQTDSDLIEIAVGIAHFQQDVDSYSGTVDTFTDGSLPSDQQGGLHYISVNDSGGVDAGLIRFDDLFGNGAGQIPIGSTIDDASLWIYVLTDDPLDQVTVHEMLTSWDETATFNSMVNGISADDTEANSAVLATLDAGTTGWVKVDGLQNVVQTWANGGTNNGLAFISQNADDWTFASSEYGTIALRPYLAIDYSVPSAAVLTPSGSTPSFVEGGSAVLLDSGLTLTDADSADLTGASLQITNYVSGQDMLSFSNQNGISGSWDGATGTLTLTGTASIANYEAALQSITYSNSSNDPDATSRSVDIVISDLYATSTAVTLSVDIIAVNDITYNAGTLPSDLIVTEDVASSLDLSSLDLADLDDRGGAITLSLSTSTGGQLTLSAAAGVAITGNGTGAITLTGTILDLNAYLDGTSNITYLHATAHQSGNNADSITVSVDDNGNTGTGSSSASLGSINVDITPVNDAPIGTPLITGTAQEGQSLTADVSGIADADGLGSFSYQWLRDGVAITGATGSSYSLGDSDVGAAMSVTVRYVDGNGTAESLTSAATVAVANVNDAPTGTPLITGTAQEGQSLTADVSGIADADGLGSFSYQWLRDGVVISGATGSSYSLGDNDVGAAISVTVSYVDGNGTAESLTSAATVAVANVNDAPTGTPLITGTAQEGQTLTADVSGIADADGLGSFSYQWLRDGVAITGATASSYSLGDSDVGAAMSVTVSYVDGNGTAESLTSAATVAVANVNDAPTGTPLITGTAQEGQSLTADVSGIADADGLGSFSYQWLRDGVAITGATGSSYSLGDSDVGAAMSVTVSYVDGNGTAESLTSAATVAVANVNDAPTGTPLITGTAQEGQSLTADVAGIADADGLGSFSYQWLRDGVAITGATGSSYSLGDSDVGAAISVTVRYVDGNGTAESLTSAATVAVANVNDAPTGTPLIAGAAQEGQSLTADVAGIADADGLGSFSYQWLRDGVAITGATGSSYSLGEGDVGAAISVTVRYVDGNGTAESLTSAATVAVANVNDAPTGTPLITGTAQEGQSLTADVAGIADADGLGSFSYQWLRDGVAITGATGSSYSLGEGDVGAAISVTVRYVDGNGTAESLTSAATVAVANVNDAPTGTPLITGTAQEGQSLTADVAGIADADGLGSFSYQWLRDGVAITGATGSSYSLGEGDVGAAISVTVRYVDGNGTAESLTSAATVAVANVNDVPTGTPLITGTAQEGQSLTADVSGIADADGLGSFSYQWLRDGVVISGATGSSYQITQNDAGKALTVFVSYIDANGTREQLQAKAVDVASIDFTHVHETEETVTPQVKEIETAPVPTQQQPQPNGSASETIQKPGQATSVEPIVEPQVEQTLAHKGDDPNTEEFDTSDKLDTGLDRNVPIFKEFKRAIHARVQYERLGFGQVQANLVYDAVDQSLRDLKQHNHILGASPVEVTLSVGTVLSAGFVTWVIRSGALMSAFMSTMPVWRGFDPMLILGSTGPVAIARARKDDEVDGELSIAERVFDRATEHEREARLR